jgi:hypothetical protein
VQINESGGKWETSFSGAREDTKDVFEKKEQVLYAGNE